MKPMLDPLLKALPLLLLILAAATLLNHDITTIDPHQASMAAPNSLSY
jgi:hypothetical protein